MDKQKIVLDYFVKLFPDARCELEYNSPYQLLIATILSAQCTDKRVNMVTKELFKVAPTPADMVKLTNEQLISIIRSCGFYNNKSKAIKDCSQEIVDKYNGKMPTDRDKLETLRGVGRKTANVVLAECFNAPVIAVDTHVHRVSARLGFSEEKDNPLETEKKLNDAFDKTKLAKLHFRMVLFGRYHCKSQKPDCQGCGLHEVCKYYKEKYER